MATAAKKNSGKHEEKELARTWQKEEDDSYDLVLATQDREFYVHSAFLGIHSPVFRAMLTHDCTESRERRVEISDFTSAQMEAFLQQIYSQSIITVHNIPLFFPVAHKYMASALKRNAVDWLQGTTHDFRSSASDLFECLCAITKYMSVEETPVWSGNIRLTLARRVIQHYNPYDSISTDNLPELNSSTLCQLLDTIMTKVGYNHLKAI